MVSFLVSNPILRSLKLKRKILSKISSLNSFKTTELFSVSKYFQWFFYSVFDNKYFLTKDIFFLGSNFESQRRLLFLYKKLFFRSFAVKYLRKYFFKRRVKVRRISPQVLYKFFCSKFKFKKYRNKFTYLKLGRSFKGILKINPYINVYFGKRRNKKRRRKCLIHNFYRQYNKNDKVEYFEVQKKKFLPKFSINYFKKAINIPKKYISYFPWYLRRPFSFFKLKRPYYLKRQISFPLRKHLFFYRRKLRRALYRNKKKSIKTLLNFEKQREWQASLKKIVYVNNSEKLARQAPRYFFRFSRIYNKRFGLLKKRFKVFFNRNAFVLKRKKAIYRESFTFDYTHDWVLKSFYSSIKTPYLIGKLIFRYTHNNMFISLVNQKNRLIYKTSAGCHGFTGPKRPTPYSKEVISRIIGNKALSLNYKIIDLCIKHRPNHYLNNILKGLADSNIAVRLFIAFKNLPHGHFRAKKKRRL